MSDLTYDDVIYQIKKACQIYRLYQKEGPSNFKSCLKSLLPPLSEKKNAFYPTPKEVDMADVVQFKWLRWLSPDDRRLVWKRCDGMPWKVLAFQEDMSVRQARYKMEQSIKTILKNIQNNTK